MRRQLSPPYFGLFRQNTNIRNSHIRKIFNIIYCSNGQFIRSWKCCVKEKIVILACKTKKNQITYLRRYNKQHLEHMSDQWLMLQCTILQIVQMVENRIDAFVYSYFHKMISLPWPISEQPFIRDRVFISNFA